MYPVASFALVAGRIRFLTCIAVRICAYVLLGRLMIVTMVSVDGEASPGRHRWSQLSSTDVDVACVANLSKYLLVLTWR